MSEGNGRRELKRGRANYLGPNKHSNAATAALCLLAIAVTAGLLAPVARAGNGVQVLPDGDVRVQGSGVPPQLFFACDSLCADGAIIAQLKDLHAGVALDTGDLSPARAQLVRHLNEAGIPVVAVLSLPGDQGGYMNSSNAPEAVARFAAFEKWTADYSLHWAAVALDIEPNLNDFAEMRQHPFRFLVTLLGRSFDGGRVRRARQAYSALIRRIYSAGYPVQTSQFPFIADERKVHSTVLERLFGIVDVRPREVESRGGLASCSSAAAAISSNENAEVLMIYSSYSHVRAGAALDWSYGPEAQGIIVGSTASSGDPATDARFPPLNWNEFCRELIVASHFSHVVGVFNLKGCIRQGFLPRLKTLDWSESVTIPAASIRRVNRFRHIIEGILWTLAHVLYFVGAIFLLVAALIWRGRARRRSPQDSPPSIPSRQSRPTQPRWQRSAPVATMLVAAPFIAELLSGATRLSYAFVLIPEIMTWGCGALIIRELVRRWRGGWNSLLLLAPAMAIAEEIIIQQTSLAPLVWVDPNHVYGRMLGVNWVWLLAMLVFETVFVVLVPIQLTELAFRSRRDETWLRTRGVAIASIVFLLGSFIAWFAWVQNYRTRVLHLPAYHPPPLYLLLGLTAILFLAVASYRQRTSAAPKRDGGSRAPSPWIAGIAALALTYPWRYVIGLNFNVLPNLAPWIPLLGGTVYTIAALLLIRHWSSASEWTDLHRFALCAGGVVAVVAWGIADVWHGLRVDFIGQLIFTAIAIFLLVRLARSLEGRTPADRPFSR
jgi:hypothetical protein